MANQLVQLVSTLTNSVSFPDPRGGGATLTLTQAGAVYSAADAATIVAAASARGFQVTSTPTTAAGSAINPSVLAAQVNALSNSKNGNELGFVQKINGVTDSVTTTAARLIGLLLAVKPSSRPVYVEAGASVAQTNTAAGVGTVFFQVSELSQTGKTSLSAGIAVGATSATLVDVSVIVAQNGGTVTFGLDTLAPETKTITGIAGNTVTWAGGLARNHTTTEVVGVNAIPTAIDQDYLLCNTPGAAVNVGSLHVPPIRVGVSTKPRIYCVTTLLSVVSGAPTAVLYNSATSPTWMKAYSL